jgi:hypothetical protein
MKTSPPPPFVQRRIWLLIAAICGLGIAALVLALFKHSLVFPVAPVAATGGIVFVLCNFAFWWLELRYPHMSDGRGRFFSRAEQAGGGASAFSGLFFFAFGIGALFVTIACLRVALDG